MKMWIAILVTAVVTWCVTSFVWAIQSNFEKVWVISNVKAPGRMVLLQIQQDLREGEYEVAKQEVDAFLKDWEKFADGPDAFRGPGLAESLRLIQRNRIDEVPDPKPGGEGGK